MQSEKTMLGCQQLSATLIKYAQKHTFSQVNNKNKKLFIEGLIEEAGVTEAQRILCENDTGENLGDRNFVFRWQHDYLNSLESRFITVTTIGLCYANGTSRVMQYFQNLRLCFGMQCNLEIVPSCIVIKKQFVNEIWQNELISIKFLICFYCYKRLAAFFAD